MNVHYMWYKTSNRALFSKKITKQRKWVEKNPKNGTNILQFGEKHTHEMDGWATLQTVKGRLSVKAD